MNKFFSQICIRNRNFFILRDDIIGGEFNGNKARKLEFYLQADLSKYTAIVSYGSSQSNAMAALSLFAKKKGLEFYYFTNHISKFLAQNPQGNFAFALKNSMKIFENKNTKFNSIISNFLKPHFLFIPQGIACKEAEYGFISQAKLIRDFMQKIKIKFDIFLPSGTGTSAVFLARNLSECEIFTTPCVGDEKYLKKQMLLLDKNPRVKILPPAVKCYFGDLKKEFYEIFLELKQSGICFELLYDPQGWLTMLANLSAFSNPILYIHQGGLEGLNSQLARYERKFNTL